MPPEGTMPPRDQFASCIAKAELDLKTKATTFHERLLAVNNCAFLCRVHMLLASEKDYDMFLDMGRKRSALHRQHTYDSSETILPQQLHPLLAQELARSREPQAPTPAADDTLQFPITLPARSLTLEEIGDGKRVKVTGADIEAYQRNPNRLPDHIFVSESSGEAFRVSSILTGEQQTLFYLVFAGEGLEAVCHTSEDFFSLLATSTVCS
ncbi:hypothetical protein B0H12DRAFT_1319898 [Mycena haematopus]|nr:hypothetical protein B0H12DRAFT_1319898 [Mycena haematopus]